MQTSNEKIEKVGVNKTKKVLSIIGNVLIWVIVAFSVLVTVFVLVSKNNEDGIPELFGKSVVSIQTDSMKPTYNVGDLVFLTKLDVDGKNALKPGDIITFRAPVDIDGDGKIGDLNTHRIESINPDGSFKTKGDNNLGADTYDVGKNSVIGKCEEDGKIAGLGGVINFLRSSLGFFLCVVLPMILFFLYELYNFISLLVARKAKAGITKEDEEEIKRKAIEEYLASQKVEQATETEKVEQPKEEVEDAQATTEQEQAVVAESDAKKEKKATKAKSKKSENE